ncbi:MAG: exosortase/archaeosortase family protein [Nitrospirales bacterium]|nr:exosortase/archaeosortase family protein [Nitrospirales bacterium]
MDVLKNNRIYLAVLVVLLSLLYFSVVKEMALQWYEDENYSHGFIVPLIAGYFLYMRREDLKSTFIRPSNAGLAVILAGLFMLIAADAAVEFFTMRASLIVVLTGLVLYFFGKDLLKISSFSLGYLLFMVPLPYIVYDSFAFPLKLFVAKYSVAFLKAIGVAVWREGNIIMLPTTTLEVADACSGIRSLMSLLALSVAFAYFVPYSNLKRWIIIFSAVPIAILTNGIRVIVTGILAQYWGAAAAEGFFHEFAGLAVFALAIILLISLGSLLGRSRE